MITHWQRIHIVLGLVTALITVPLFLHAQTAEELREKIDKQQSDIERIEQEIEKFEEELVEIGEEKQTLQGAVRELDVSRQKVGAKISLAEKQIDNTQKSIGELTNDITEKEGKIERNKEALAETLRRMHVTESTSFVEVILNSQNISELWTDLETIQQFQGVMRTEVNILAQQKVELEDVKAEKEGEQEVLVAQKTELSTQKRALDINRREKNNLLDATKNEEATYQELLAEKRAAKAEFEAQLRSYESELQYVLDPETVPPAGKGVLSYPLSNVRITQYFGTTKFSQSGAYSGSGHNGIDFGAPVGTPVKASLGGNVRATGNTDAFRGCYSYGKWVLLEHANGLSTLYAHLSDINVEPGTPVSTGSIIGYSGNTGYSTGPHLHFTVYASEAVQVVRLGDVKARTNCADAKIPVSPWSGYLNPLDYL